jgi:hypothetical protein
MKHAEQQINQFERNSKLLNFILNQINVIIYSYQHSMKNDYPGFFKFYQPKATGGGFLIFEWSLYNLFQNQKSTNTAFYGVIKND